MYHHNDFLLPLLVAFRDLLRHVPGLSGLFPHELGIRAAREVHCVLYEVLSVRGRRCDTCHLLRDE